MDNSDDDSVDSTTDNYRDLDNLIDDCIMHIHHHCVCTGEINWNEVTNDVLPYIQVNNLMTQDDENSKAKLHAKMHPHSLASQEHDYEQLQHFFRWLSTDTIHKTIKHSMQHACMLASANFKKLYKFPFPAANVPRCNEAIAIDKIVSDTLAIASGAKRGCNLCRTRLRPHRRLPHQV